MVDWERIRVGFGYANPSSDFFVGFFGVLGKANPLVSILPEGFLGLGTGGIVIILQFKEYQEPFGAEEIEEWVEDQLTSRS
jgi:hypothetical protein